MSKKVTQSNKTYQIRPPFKDKFRPAVKDNIFKLSSQSFSIHFLPIMVTIL